VNDAELRTLERVVRASPDDGAARVRLHDARRRLGLELLPARRYETGWPLRDPSPMGSVLDMIRYFDDYYRSFVLEALAPPGAGVAASVYENWWRAEQIRRAVFDVRR
jgi:hypothetical protein